WTLRPNVCSRLCNWVINRIFEGTSMKRFIVTVAALAGILLLQGCAIYARPYGYGYYGGSYYGYAPYYGYNWGYWPFRYYYPYYYYGYRPYRYYDYWSPRPRPDWQGGTWGGRYGGRQSFPDRSGGPGNSGRGSLSP